MSANERYEKKQARKKMIIRVLAVLLCVGLLVTMVAPYVLY